MVEVELTKQCGLSVQAGTPEPCWLNTCAFWQDGGADLAGGCAVERLELDRNGIDVADFLLGVRRRLESTALLPPAEAATTCRPSSLWGK